MKIDCSNMQQINHMCRYPLSKNNASARQPTKATKGNHKQAKSSEFDL